MGLMLRPGRDVSRRDDMDALNLMNVAIGILALLAVLAGVDVVLIDRTERGR